MSGAELLSEAAAELYACDLAAFAERRTALAARARAAGEASAAKQIAALRKPTRSAWAINQLVRADPSVPSRLAALGDGLRAAEAELDGEKIRELSLARRQLVDALVRQALWLPGQPTPSAVLQEEVTATFGAALADPQVAEQLAAGTLLRAEHRAGFGPGGRRPLAPVQPSGEARRARATARPTARPVASTAASTAARPVAVPAAAQAERARRKAVAEAGRARRKAVAEAERALAEASLAADVAAKAELEQLSVVRRAEEQLADARQRLAEVRLRARRARSAQGKARWALDRLHK
ncbi:MAG TPA: hypothetical protein DHU96_30790 [Actinobacteria bacterium]|nr:hypothetical protein [Actinomycetota bacterium]